MQTLAIDKRKNPDIADGVVDLEPGDRLDLHTTIKSNDEQTLVVTVEEVSVPKAEEETEDETETETGNVGSGDVGGEVEETVEEE
ncbi:MAG: hypothetical protein KKA68_21280 [Gammaproteobacteria bacterium]|nr:hypothetical protein [Gammaproteobacteria bacterium]